MPTPAAATKGATFPRDVCVVGGAGHVGLPLAITFAETRLSTAIYDINVAGNQAIREGRMPFIEHGGEALLRSVLELGTLQTLKRFKDEVNEVNAGQECGMAFAGFQDIKAGDVIECFTVETIKRSL
jgi:translation initiation factor IF-2